jgi:HNH endonuclease
LLTGREKKPASQRFWGHVAPISRADGCWIWNGDPDKYGSFFVNQRSMKAHRFSWEMVNGTVPENMDLLHRCDVPGCVNPAHLFLGTHADNMADMVAKGRRRGSPADSLRRGERHVRAKLSETQVMALRRGFTGSIRAIARNLGVSHRTIRNVLDGKTWTHV